MRDTSRMQAVQPAIVPAIAELARQTPGTISLAQGVVWYGPPPAAVEALAGLRPDPAVHRYGPVTGEPELVEAIEQKLEADNGIRVGPDRRVVVTAGSNMGFLNAVLATTHPGDEVILLSPYYFNHDMAIGMAGCRTVKVETGGNWGPTPSVIERAIGPTTRAVVTVSPNNPSGAVYDEDCLREINGICERHGIYHINDEAYEYFTYGAARHCSPGSRPGSEGHTISLFSFSKTYGMAGWRVGYMLIPEHLLEAVNKVQDTNLICPTILSQRLALAALREGSGYCRQKVREMDEVRKLVVSALRALDDDRCRFSEPEGAFYCLLMVGTRLSSITAAERLIRNHRVALVPGSAFGIDDVCTLRLSFGALDRETVAEGVGRLVEGIRSF